MIGSVGEDGRQRGRDGAELRRFKATIIGGEDGIEVGGAVIELLGEVGSFVVEVAKHGANCHKQEKEDDAGYAEFDN